MIIFAQDVGTLIDAIELLNPKSADEFADRERVRELLIDLLHDWKHGDENPVLEVVTSGVGELDQVRERQFKKMAKYADESRKRDLNWAREKDWVGDREMKEIKF